MKVQKMWLVIKNGISFNVKLASRKASLILITLLEEACGTYRPKWCFCGPSCQINWVTVYSDGSNQSCTYLLVHGTNRQHANSASKSCHPKCEKPRYERNKFTSIKISRTVCLIFQNYNFTVSWYYSATNTKIEIMEEMEIFYF